MNSHSTAHITPQRAATHALIKFCEDQGYDVQGVNDLRSCSRALQMNNIQKAVEAYQRVPLGRMGCFDDWLPPVIFDHESPGYVRTVFEALVTHWNILMRLSLPDEKTRHR